MSRRTNAIIVMASAILLAAPAAAVDGEILIDQAKVNVGGITPGDAPGFPVTLGKSGRYKLTGNLKVPAGKDGIEVTQHDVTIDLNGFAISSDPPGEASSGVFAPDNVTGPRVMNGTITGFSQYAIDNRNGESLMVENMRIVSNKVGINGGTESRIRNSTIANGSGGIGCSDRCLIEQNVITGNTGVGISVFRGGQVLGNVIVGNGGYGLAAANTAATGYGGNILFGNKGGGAQLAGNLLPLHPNVCEPACP